MKNTRRALPGLLRSVPSVSYVLVAVIVLFSFVSRDFYSWTNFINIIRQGAVLVIVSMGMMIVIVCAGIDLSVGAMLGLAGTVLAVLLRRGLTLPEAIPLCLVACGICGLVSGGIVTKGRIFPFIVTFGMLFMVRSISLGITVGGSIHISNDAFTAFGNSMYAGVPAAFWITLALVVIIAIVMRRTSFGTHAYAIGINAENARSLGIRVDTTLVAAYVTSALLAGIAGVILASRVASGNALVGMGTEFEAVASVVVGGTPITGGRGSLAGTVIGALFITILRNGMNLMGLSSELVAVIIGVSIMAAVVGAQFLYRGAARE
jgi:ribose transport system permease protein